MEERKKSAYEYLSKCLFTASEYLREAADTIDLESLKAVDYGTIERLSKDIEKTAQKCQRLAKGKEADE